VKLALLPDWLSAEGLFEILGPWALIGFTIIIFLECGLFIGILFPGDSLLFLTGMLVASGAIDQPLWLVISLLSQQQYLEILLAITLAITLAQSSSQTQIHDY